MASESLPFSLSPQLTVRCRGGLAMLAELTDKREVGESVEGDAGSEALGEEGLSSTLLSSSAGKLVALVVGSNGRDWVMPSILRS